MLSTNIKGVFPPLFREWWMGVIHIIPLNDFQYMDYDIDTKDQKTF